MTENIEKADGDIFSLPVAEEMDGGRRLRRAFYGHVVDIYIWMGNRRV